MDIKVKFAGITHKLPKLTLSMVVKTWTSFKILNIFNNISKLLKTVSFKSNNSKPPSLGTTKALDLVGYRRTRNQDIILERKDLMKITISEMIQLKRINLNLKFAAKLISYLKEWKTCRN